MDDMEERCRQIRIGLDRQEKRIQKCYRLLDRLADVVVRLLDRLADVVVAVSLGAEVWDAKKVRNEAMEEAYPCTPLEDEGNKP